MAGNPILEALGSKPQNNRAALLQQAKALMEGNNPIMAAVRMMTAGRDPQQVFYDECQKRGVNPDDILQMIR